MSFPRFDFPRYTYNDYKNWKEDWELIDGYPFQFLPSGSPTHSRIQGNLIYQSKDSLLQNPENCNCVVFVELDWRINDETVLRPDMMIVCGEPKDDYLNFPPVLVAEVISPTSIQKDRVIKFQIYQEQGVNFYLLVDPLKETVEVFQLIDNQYKQVFENKMKIDKNCEVSFDFEKLWN